jgi:hypothetical protein
MRLNSSLSYVSRTVSTLTDLQLTTSATFSTLFEDKKSCVDLINTPKMSPRTGHIAFKYHHFGEHVRNGAVKIQWIDTSHQINK